MGATLTITDTINLVQPFLGFYPLAVNATNYPALHIANTVRQSILAPPFKWRWNRNTVNWITTSGTQTYMAAGSWANATVYAAGVVIIDGNGNGQKVIIGGTSGGTTPTFGTTIFSTTIDNTVEWQNVGPLGNISTVADFGFTEKAQIQDVNNGNAWKEIGLRLDISRDSSISCPKYISAQTDDNAGDVSFRLLPVPGAAYPVSVQYQKAAALFTNLSSLWAPIPDYMFYVYSWGFLALALLYKSDSRFAFASQQFVTRLLSFAEGLSEAEKNIFLMTWSGITNEIALTALKQTQGNQARLVV